MTITTPARTLVASSPRPSRSSPRVGLNSRSDVTAVVAILHPMQPLGNIDCCH